MQGEASVVWVDHRTCPPRARGLAFRRRLGRREAARSETSRRETRRRETGRRETSRRDPRGAASRDDPALADHRARRGGGGLDQRGSETGGGSPHRGRAQRWHRSAAEPGAGLDEDQRPGARPVDDQHARVHPDGQRQSDADRRRHRLLRHVRGLSGARRAGLDLRLVRRYARRPGPGAAADGAAAPRDGETAERFLERPARQAEQQPELRPADQPRHRDLGRARRHVVDDVGPQRRGRATGAAEFPGFQPDRAGG